MDPLTIDPDAIYTPGTIAVTLDVPLSAIARARRTGGLRSVRIGQRVLIRGQWILDWLNAPAEHTAEVSHAH